MEKEWKRMQKDELRWIKKTNKTKSRIEYTVWSIKKY